jgi:hypothetical protein
VETILGFSARLYKVRQMSWRPAQVNRALLLTRILTPSCLYIIHIGNEGRVKYSPPLPHAPVFLPKVTRIFGPLLLVDGRALPEPATHFYWSTYGENRQPDSICRQADRMIQMRAIHKTHLPVSGDRTCQILTVWFLSLDDEPIRGSHFSSFLHILPLKQYNG